MKYHKGRLRIYGMGGGDLYVSASKIKPAPPAGGQKFYLAPLHDFTIEK